VAWDIYCLPHTASGIGIFYCHNQGFSLCAKWIIRSLKGVEAWKILIWHCISTGLPYGRKSYKGLDLQIILTTQFPINIVGSFIAKSI